MQLLLVFILIQLTLKSLFSQLIDSVLITFLLKFLYLGVGGISSLSHNQEPIEDLEFKDNGYGADQDDLNTQTEYNYGGKS